LLERCYTRLRFEADNSSIFIFC